MYYIVEMLPPLGFGGIGKSFMYNWHLLFPFVSLFGNWHQLQLKGCFFSDFLSLSSIVSKRRLSVSKSGRI